MKFFDQLALIPLRKAVTLNPHNIRAQQLLADLLLMQKKGAEAHVLLEKLYQSHPEAARSRLIQVLLLLAHSNDNEQKQLEMYKRVLGLDVQQAEAQKAIQKILQQQGEVVRITRDIEARLIIINQAKQAFRYTEALQKLQQLAKEYPQQRDWNKIEREIPHHEFETRLQVIFDTEQAGDYEEALEKARWLLEDYSDKKQWVVEQDKIAQKITSLEQAIRNYNVDDRLKLLEYSEQDDKKKLHQKTQLIELYQNLLIALKENDKESAKNLLAEIVGYEHSISEFSINDSRNVIKTMHQYAEELAIYQQQGTELKLRLAQEEYVRIHTQQELIGYLQHKNELTQSLEQERKSRIETEHALTQLIQQDNDLQKRLELEQTARTKAEHAIINSRTQEDSLKQSLSDEKQAHKKSQQQENELQEQIVQERKTQQTLEQKVNQLNIQETALKQVIDQEKERSLHTKEIIEHQYQAEMTLLKKDSVSKEQTLHQLEQKLHSQEETHLKQYNHEKKSREQTEAILLKVRQNMRRSIWFKAGFLILTLMFILTWWVINTQEAAPKIVEKTPPVSLPIPSPVIIPKIIVTTPPLPPITAPIITQKKTVTIQNICVHFKERSWIRIIDKKDKRLYEGIGDIGDILFLTGTPPFSMKVGKMNGVYIEENCDITRVISYPKQEGHNNLFIIGTEQ